jgi:type I restriction enzyme M protein
LKRSKQAAGESRAGSEREEYNRPDFIKMTSNKQLNFLQHIMSVLKENGSGGGGLAG